MNITRVRTRSENGNAETIHVKYRVRKEMEMLTAVLEAGPHELTDTTLGHWISAANTHFPHDVHVTRDTDDGVAYGAEGVRRWIFKQEEPSWQQLQSLTLHDN